MCVVMKINAIGDLNRRFESKALYRSMYNLYSDHNWSAGHCGGGGGVGVGGSRNQSINPEPSNLKLTD